MRLILMTMAGAILVGFATGGRLGNLLERRFRWSGIAIAGLSMQFVPLPASLEWLGLPILIVSFVPLCLFVGANMRLPGAGLILMGVLMNFAVIAANQGMPVSRHALVESNQQATLESLIEQGGIRHHLASSEDVLLPLGDVIPVGGFIHQAVSLGDIFAYGGVGWMLLAGMQPVRRRKSLVLATAQVSGP
ncbi:MAG: DUF5317 family protein [Actinomycetota bacterium]